MNADDKKPAVNIGEPVESAERSARAEERTVQDELRDTRKENEMLKKMITKLAKHNIELKKRLGAYESAVPNEAPGSVTSISDAARKLVLSSSAREQNLSESQIEQFSDQDLSNFVEKYYQMEKENDSLIASCEEKEKYIKTVEKEITVRGTLQIENENLRTHNGDLQAENKELCERSMQLSSENIYLHFEKLKQKLQGGEVCANDNEDGNNSAEDGENSNQVKPAELVRFSNGLNCPVSCGFNVVLFILYMMGIRLCIRRFIAEVQCVLNKSPETKSEVGKCSLSLAEFLKAGLIDEVFSRPITDEYKIDDALRDAKEKIQGQSHPAALMIDYEEGPDGRKPIGHCVAIMPNGKFIDVQERKYWEANSDSPISYIYVVNVKESEVIEWQRKCGLQKCEAECIVCSSECSTGSLE